MSIMSCFPGTGKTYLAKHDSRYIDMESSEYHWLDFDASAQEQKKEHYKELNPDWPSNYVTAILEQKRLYPDKHILISCQPEVLDALEKVNVELEYIYPIPSEKSLAEYTRRMKERGNSEEFINKMKAKFYNFINELGYRRGYKVIINSKYTLNDLANGTDKQEFKAETNWTPLGICSYIY